MVGGWRRAFCTTIPRDREPKIATDKHNNNHQKQSSSSSINDENQIPSPKVTSKFGFFSNPSTPRLQSQPVSSPSLRCKTSTAETTIRTTASASNSPRLHCKTTTKNSPRFFRRSLPSSPKSPSSFSLLRTSLRLSKSRCGICLQNVKTGQGTAIFTAECSHTFHFPCIAAHIRNQESLVCPVCSVHWKEMPLLAVDNNNNKNLNQNQKPGLEEDDDKNKRREKESSMDVKTKDYNKNLKVYNDDEPLMSPTAGSGL